MTERKQTSQQSGYKGDTLKYGIKFNRFMIKKKTLNKVGIKGTNFNIIEAIYDKTTVNILFNSKQLKPFCLRS